MSYLTKPMNKWTTEDFMLFISSLRITGTRYNQIKTTMDETGLVATDIKGTPDDIKALFGISIILARKINKALIGLNVTQKTNPQSPPARAPSTRHNYTQSTRSNAPSTKHNYFRKKNVTQFTQNINHQSPPARAPSTRHNYAQSTRSNVQSAIHYFVADSFKVNLRGKQGKMTTLRNSFTMHSRVEEVVLSYKEQECVQMSYKVEKIVLMARNKVLQHNKTLAYYGIKSSNNLITVIFKTKGGAMATNNDTDRCIKFKKYGLRQTSLPDVLIGYDDSDGIDRALLECGKHAMSAETMFQYITSSLASNLNQTEIMCPDNGCGKVLDWEICTQIADMNTAEYMKWTDVIEKRAMVNCKRCPYCEAYCLRDDGVAIFRMHCIACNGGDWCWECCQPWKGSGNSMCCNQNCNLIF
eukprot:166535_1